MAHVSTNNQGYFFENNFDTFLYLMLSVIYPILGFFIELGRINASDIGACYDVLTTGLLFTATFFMIFTPVSEIVMAKPLALLIRYQSGEVYSVL